MRLERRHGSSHHAPGDHDEGLFLKFRLNFSGLGAEAQSTTAEGKAIAGAKYRRLGCVYIHIIGGKEHWVCRGPRGSCLHHY